MLYSMLTVLQKVYKNQCILMIFQIFLHSNFEPQHKTKVYKKHQIFDPKLIKKVSQNWLQGVVSNTYDMMPNTHPKNVPKWSQKGSPESSKIVQISSQKCPESVSLRLGLVLGFPGQFLEAFLDRFGLVLGSVWALFAEFWSCLGLSWAASGRFLRRWDVFLFFFLEI